MLESFVAFIGQAKAHWTQVFKEYRDHYKFFHSPEVVAARKRAAASYAKRMAEMEEGVEFSDHSFNI